MKHILIIIILSFFSDTCFGQIKAAIIQYAIQQADSVGIDDDRFENFVREAALKGAKLIIGPETSFYRYEPWLQNGVSIRKKKSKWYKRWSYSK